MTDSGGVVLWLNKEGKIRGYEVAVEAVAAMASRKREPFIRYRRQRQDALAEEVEAVARLV